jgi:cyanophycinase
MNDKIVYMNNPKGYLVAIGGAEDKGNKKKQKESIINFQENGTLQSLVQLIAKHHTPRIEVVSTASSIPTQLAAEYMSAFKRLGCTYVGHLNIQSRDQANNNNVLSRLRSANCVFFTGGDQSKLCTILSGTSFIDILKYRYAHEPFFIAGSSAGAAAMSHTIIAGGNAAKGYKKGHVNLSIGFGFMPEAIIDTHFDKRGRLARLLQAIANEPEMTGIGLSEDTGIIVENGHTLKAIGSGTIVIVEGSKLSYNNLQQLHNNAPFTLGHVVLHTLSNSDTYDTNTRELKPASFKEYLLQNAV